MSQQATYPESDDPVHERWEWILTWIPEMRRRRLTDDHTTLYQEIIEHGSGQRLLAALDLSILVTRYWIILGTQGHVFPGAMTVNRDYGYYWQTRFQQRVEQTCGVKREGYRLRKPHVPPLDPPSFVH